MKPCIVFLTFSIFFFKLNAQEGGVKVIKDNRLNILVEKQSEIIPPATNPQINGYRVQLFFDATKAKVDKVRSQFNQIHKDIPTYIEYKAPNFFLKVGDFRTKLEAEKIKFEYEANYPTCFVIQEKINLPAID